MNRLHFILIAIGVFVVAFTIQFASMYWLQLGYGDGIVWADGAAQIAAGHQLTVDHEDYRHPGTTILYPAAALIFLGMEPLKATNVWVTLCVSLGIMCAVLCAYVLRPRVLWWLAVAIVLIFDTRYFGATPPSALAAVLALNMFLLLWLVYERQYNNLLLVLVGITAVLLLDSRIDTGLYMLAASGFLLIVLTKWRSLITLVVAIATAVLCNPYLWKPLTYLHNMRVIVEDVKNIQNNNGDFTFILFTSLFAVTLVSVALSFGVLHYIGFKKDGPGMPRLIYTWLVITTVLVSTLLVLAPSHPLRYFFPFLILWDAVLPLWFYALLENFGVKDRNALVVIIVMLLIPLRFALYLAVPWVF